MPRRVLLYIIYGEDAAYYDGAKFGILTFLNHMRDEDPVEIVVLTEKPERFDGYPVQTITMSRQQKEEWSLGGRYHFRIKNRGIAFVMDALSISDEDKLLFIDADLYFYKNPLPLFDLILSDQAVLYLNEGLVYKKKRFDVYVESLEGKSINLSEGEFVLSKDSAMWGSAIIGVSGSMKKNIHIADQLIRAMIDLVPAHTIEQFSLSESLLRNYRIVEGKKYVGLYSTSGKKVYADQVIRKFFLEGSDLAIEQLIDCSKRVKIRRPLHVIVKQRLVKYLESL